MGTSIKLKIDQAGEYSVNPADIDNPDRQDCQAMSQILNVIVKQAMSETGMLQFGARPRFFDSKNPINVAELQMQIWNGFKASAYKYQSGCALIIDNCSRFMSTLTVLDRIHELFDEVETEYQGRDDHVRIFQESLRKEMINSSVIANYGTKRTYVIKNIIFDKGPCSCFFSQPDGTKISVAKYFYQQYNLKVTDKRQPMLITYQNGREISLVPEFCLMDGVPDALRANSRSMRTLLNQVKQNPDEKMRSIVKMVQELFAMKKWEEWDI